jgi:hypothetical protein
MPPIPLSFYPAINSQPAAKASSAGSTAGTPPRLRSCVSCPISRDISKGDLTVAELEQVARAGSDTAAAQKMQKAKQKLFDGIRRKRTA